MFSSVLRHDKTWSPILPALASSSVLKMKESNHHTPASLYFHDEQAAFLLCSEISFTTLVQTIEQCYTLSPRSVTILLLNKDVGDMQLQLITAFPLCSSRPFILPVSSVHEVFGIVEEYVKEARMQKRLDEARQAKTKRGEMARIFELLEMATTNQRRDEHTTFLLTNTFPTLKSFVEACTGDDAPVRLSMALNFGESIEEQDIVDGFADFWERDWVAE